MSRFSLYEADVRMVQDGRDFAQVYSIISERKTAADAEKRELFINDFNVGFTHDSEAIEGNTVTLEETRLIIERNVTIDSKPAMDVADIRGSAEAYKYAVSVATKEALPLAHPVICHTQAFICRDERSGVYRVPDMDVAVVNSLSGKIMHKAPPGDMVLELMDNLVSEYNYLRVLDGINIFALLAAFHVIFESIHSFMDGNGRTGRLLINYELLKAGWLPISLKKENSSVYFAAFNRGMDGMKTMAQLFMASELTSQIEYAAL